MEASDRSKGRTFSRTEWSIASFSLEKSISGSLPKLFTELSFSGCEFGYKELALEFCAAASIPTVRSSRAERTRKLT